MDIETTRLLNTIIIQQKTIISKLNELEGKINNLPYNADIIRILKKIRVQTNKIK